MAKAPKPINDTTYEVELLGKDKVEIGDKGSADFKPHIKLNRWDGECFIKLGLPTTKKPKPIVEGDKVKFKSKDFEAHFYALDPKTVIAKGKEGEDVEFTQNELGGFEFEIILKKKSLTNKVILNIETQGLKFCYQPPLTQEEINAGDVQPDNVVGSYAVYHASRTNMHRNKEDAEKYRCGKAFHIYRPKITDAEGKWVWGNLHIDVQAGTLTTTIPQDFLDTAIYPVSTGTTNFGYETIGSLSSGLENYVCASQYASGGTGLGESITAYTTDFGAGDKAKCALYDASRNLVTNGTTEEKENQGTTWVTFNFGTAPTISNADYIIAGWGDGTGIMLNRDADVSVDRWWESHTYNGFPAISASDRTGKFSIYCTYGPAIEAPTVTTQAVSSIAATTATGNGNITNTGGEDASAWGTCLATTANPDTGDTVDAGSGAGGTGAFTTSISGLASPMKYHVRAYATNTGGTGYGANVTFITLMTASTAIGIAATASRNVTLARLASTAIGITVAASKSKIAERFASVAIGISVSAARGFTHFHRTASTAIGVTASAVRGKLVLSRVASTAIGVTVFARRGFYKFASSPIGITVSASRVKTIKRLASTAIGVTATASRVKNIVRTASTAIGVTATATKGRVIYHRLASVAIGIAVSVSIHKEFIRKASVAISIAVSAGANWAWVKFLLRKRVTDFTLPDRIMDFTLPKRVTDFTLRSRDGE